MGEDPAVALRVEASLPGRPSPPPAPPLAPPPRRRSIFGLPVASCRSPAARAWSLIVLIIDLTYTAFALPVSIGFQARRRLCVYGGGGGGDLMRQRRDARQSGVHSHTPPHTRTNPPQVPDLEWNWSSSLDLITGAAFAAELALGFHLSFVATSHGQQREASRGGGCARCRGHSRAFSSPTSTPSTLHHQVTSSLLSAGSHSSLPQVWSGRKVAAYYMRHGSFWQDLVSTGAWLAQVGCGWVGVGGGEGLGGERLQRAWGGGDMGLALVHGTCPHHACRLRC